MQTEEWRGIAGYPRYEVSNLGNVRSWAKIGRVAKGERADEPHAMKTISVKKQGILYSQVTLYGPKGGKPHLIHQLVVEAFHGPRPVGMVTRHLNGNGQDNRAENVVWGTYSENAMDRYAHGTATFHGQKIDPVLTDEQVIDVYVRTQLGETVTSIHSDYKHVSREHIRLIARGQSRTPVIKRWLESHRAVAA